MVDLWAMSARMCMQSFVTFRCVLKSLGDFWTLRELIPTRTTTGVAFWDPPSGSKNT